MVIVPKPCLFILGGILCECREYVKGKRQNMDLTTGGFGCGG